MTQRMHSGYPRPNWRRWTHVQNFQLWQLVALSLDIDPDKFQNENYSGGDNSRVYEEFKLRVSVAADNDNWWALAKASMPDHLRNNTDYLFHEACKRSENIFVFSQLAQKCDWSFAA